MADWQGLLKWSVQQTDGTRPSEIRQLSEEDKRFLEEALKSVSVDPMQRILELYNVLQKSEDEDSVIQEKEEALEELIDSLGQIDFASDFHKIGGLRKVFEMMSHTSPGIRLRACDVFCTVVQNNPFTQQAAQDMNAMATLLQLVNAPDNDIQLSLKYFAALSSLVRSNPVGQEAFLLGDGLQTVRTALSSSDTRLQRKALFLLRHVFASVPRIQESIIELRLIPLISRHIGDEDMDLRESSLEFIAELLSHSNELKREVLNQSPNLQQRVQERKTVIEGDAELEHELNLCNRILQELKE
eukprot:GILK01001421.1.p1 GENE.GILK01001421.1~~GILK01001421.1.p1  ORF type:complete len:309 (+),score=75.25 GILK01001421.1:30-929(+)